MEKVVPITMVVIGVRFDDFLVNNMGASYFLDR